MLKTENKYKKKIIIKHIALWDKEFQEMCSVLLHSMHATYFLLFCVSHSFNKKVLSI